MNNIVDSSNMFKSIYDFSSNIESAFEIGEKILLNNNYNSINRVVIAGIGGSAIGGDVVRLLISSSNNIPITVSRNYNLPSWVDENSLVICSSYSGNTEETLSSFDDAKNKNYTMFFQVPSSIMISISGLYWFFERINLI